MYKSNLTEAEAKILLAKYKKEPPCQFCPLIKATCRTDCVCFVEPRIHETTYHGEEETAVSVYSGYCGNAMFTETEIVMP